MKSNLFCYFVAHAFSIIFKNPLPPIQGHENLHLFSSKNFMVLALIFSPFWVNFCIWYEVGVRPYSFALWKSSCSSVTYWKDHSFPIEWTWCPCQKSTGCRFMDLLLKSWFYSICLYVYPVPIHTILIAIALQ